MEYFYYIEVLLLFLGLFLAFISAVFISADYNNDELTEDDTILSQLKKIKKHYDYTDSPFLPLELLFYSASFLILVFNFQELFNTILPALYIFPLFFILSIAFRTIFYFLGVKFSNNLINKFSKIILFFYYFELPISQIIKNLGKKISGKTKEDMSFKELSAIVDNVCEEGTFGFGELKILKNIMRFKEVFVSDIMTPRTVIFSLQSDSTIAEVIDLPEIKMYSRIPLRDGESLDDGVSGYVMTKDIYYSALKGNSHIPIRELAREVFYVPENGELDIALDLFLKNKQHIFLVVDEYGGIEGLLTMEDVIETILGAEIVDEADKVVDLREFAKHRRDRRIAVASMQNEI